MSSFTALMALLSVAFMSISLAYLSSGADPIDCTRWIAEANSILPHSQSNWAHTFVDSDGNMYANEQFPEEEKDACTRLLHSKLQGNSRRLSEIYSYANREPSTSSTDISWRRLCRVGLIELGQAQPNERRNESRPCGRPPPITLSWGLGKGGRVTSSPSPPCGVPSYYL